MDKAGCTWFDTEGSKVNKVGWLECDGAEDFRSRRRCWLELLSSAGEERGPWLAEEMFLRESVKRRKSSLNGKGREGVLIPKWVVRRGENTKGRDNGSAAAFSSSCTCPGSALPERRAVASRLWTSVLLLEATPYHSLGSFCPTSRRCAYSRSRSATLALEQGQPLGRWVPRPSLSLVAPALIISLKAKLALLNEALLPEDLFTESLDCVLLY